MTDDLERRLWELRPAAMPPELVERICQSEPAACGKIAWFPWWAPLAAAAAAIAILALTVPSSGRKTEKRTARVESPFARSRPPADSTASDFRLFVPIVESDTLFSLCCFNGINSERSEGSGAMRHSGPYRLGASYLNSDARIALRLDLPIDPARSDYDLPLPEDSFGSHIGLP